MNSDTAAVFTARGLYKNIRHCKGKVQRKMEKKRRKGERVLEATPTSPSSHSLFILFVSVRIVDVVISGRLVRSVRTGIPINLS